MPRRCRCQKGTKVRKAPNIYRLLGEREKQTIAELRADKAEWLRCMALPGVSVVASSEGNQYIFQDGNEFIFQDGNNFVI